MNLQMEMMKISTQIKKLKINLDTDVLKNEINAFHNCLIVRGLHISDKKKQEKRIIKSINRVIQARTNFDNCMTTLKSSFEIESNTYISQVNKDFKSYTAFLNFLGISNARLDLFNETISDIERTRDISYNPISLTKIGAFRQVLIHYMSGFVISSLKEALKKFDRIGTEMVIFDEKGNEVKKTIVKDSNLFFYLLFLECYRVSEVEGAYARQAILSSGKVTALKSSLENVAHSAPPQLPPNAEFQYSGSVDNSGDLFVSDETQEESYV